MSLYVDDVDPAAIQFDIELDDEVEVDVTAVSSVLVRVMRPDSTTVDWTITPEVLSSRKLRVVRKFAVGDLTVAGTYRCRAWGYVGASLSFPTEPFLFPVSERPVPWPT
jgi:hypothetical protein